MENKETKKCPYCGEEILATAKKCKYCKQWIEGTTTCHKDVNEDSGTEKQSSESGRVNPEPDKPFKNKRRIIWIVAISAVIILALTPLGISSYKKYSVEREKEQYRQWLVVHSYAEVDYRNYPHFKDYVRAVFEKRGLLKFKGYNGSNPIELKLFRADSKATVWDEECINFEGTYRVSDKEIILSDSAGIEKYRITFSGEEPATFHEILYEKLNTDLGTTTLYRDSH